MKAYGESSRSPVGYSEKDRESLEKGREERLKKLRGSFREVFGPKGSRSEAQKLVLAKIAYEAYYDRPLSHPPTNNEGFFGREGMRTLYLWIRDLADSDFEPAVKRSVKVDKGEPKKENG